jgi:hypothetical protein
MHKNAKLHGEPNTSGVDPFTKVIKIKKLDKESTLKMTQNLMSGRIFVEFSSEDGKLVLQKSFQDTYDGNKEAQKFSKKIKSIDDLRKYFGLGLSRTYKTKESEIIVNDKKLLSLKEMKNVTNKNNGRN